MNNQSWNRLLAVFTEASELKGRAQSEYLDRACRGDQWLRTEVEHLLTSDAWSGDFLSPPAPLDLLDVARHEHRIELPERIGEFRVLRALGHGGGGVVYLAVQESLQRLVAVKVLSAPLLSEQAAERFRREALTAAKLDHPGIVRVIAAGVEGGRPYIVMEYVDGADLEQELRALWPPAPAPVAAAAAVLSHPRLAETAARIVREVAEALEHAHSRGVVHRDVKPSNILIDEQGRARLTDFGLAKDAAATTLTGSGVLGGTVAYMSPEQARGPRASVDHRTDVYSLGVVLYQTLTGRRPYEAEEHQQILAKIGREDPVRVRKYNPAIPVDLESICHKAMSGKVEERYATAADFARDLERFLRHQAVEARPPSLLTRAKKHLARHKMAASAALALPIFTFTGIKLAADARAQEYVTWVDSVIRAFHGELGEDEKDRVAIPAGFGRADLDRAKAAFAVYRSIRVLADRGDLDGALLARFMSVMGETIRLKVHPEEQAAGAEVLLSVIDPLTGAIGAAERIGAVPMGEFSLPQGQYRLTIVKEGLGFGEATRHLTRPGKTVDVEVWLRRTEEVTRDMVLVPAASFSKSHQIEEGKDGKVTIFSLALPAFYVDRHEVTNGEYAEFLQATGRKPPVFWPVELTPEWADRPVAGVGLKEAQEYAEFRGKRLPTFLEWQYAARGAELRPFPWGDEAGDLENRARLGLAKFYPSGRGDEDQELAAWYLESFRPWNGEGSRPDGVLGLYQTLDSALEWTESLALREIEGEIEVHLAHYMGGPGSFVPYEWVRAAPGFEYVPEYPSYEKDCSTGFRCAKSAQPHRGDD